MPRNLLSFRIWRQVCRWGIHCIGNNNSNYFFERYPDTNFTNTIGWLHDANRRSIREPVEISNIVSTFHRERVGQIDFNNDLISHLCKNFIIANRCCRDNHPFFSNGNSLKDRHFHMLPTATDDFSRFRKMAVDIHQFTTVDCITECT